MIRKKKNLKKNRNTKESHDRCQGTQRQNSKEEMGLEVEVHGRGGGGGGAAWRPEGKLSVKIGTSA